MVLVICCNVFLAVIIWFQNKFILQILEKKDIGIVDIKTWSLFSKCQWNSYSPTIFKSGEYGVGDYISNSGSGQTPVTWLITPEGRKLILDYQAEFVNGFEKIIFSR